VPADIGLSNRGLFIEIVPADPLERFTEYEVRVSNQIRDLSGDALDAGISFRFTTGSPAAGKIAYHRMEFSSPTRQEPKAIYVVNADGSDIQRLSPPTTMGDSRPEWSPDGTKLAFQRGFIDGDNADIWIMDADGGNAMQLTANSRSDSDARWSADGSQIVYYSCSASRCAIMLMNADGTNPRDLATGWDPDISPDGTRILFSYYEPGSDGPYCSVEEFYNCAIYVVNVDGTGLTQIETELGGYPRWSPEGSKIAFVKNIRLDSEAVVGLSTLYIMNADGSDATTVVTDRIVNPDWSPDGSQIVYESSEPYPSLRGAIVTVYADGTGSTTVVPHDFPNWNGHPSWGP
jgi:Tol biopolymer transport system component